MRCLLLIATILTTVGLARASAEDKVKTVRVGYYQGDVSFQNGFSDDVRKSGYAYEYYQVIASLNNWKYQYVYGTRNDIIDQLLSGEVDIVAGVLKTENLEGKVLFSDRDMELDGEQQYFAVNISRPDLLEELNRAQNKIFTDNSEFASTLRQKYYSQYAHKTFAEPYEKEWLAQKGELNIGYVRHNLPLSDQAEDGSPTGLVSDLLSMLSGYLNVPLNPVCYENVELMQKGLCNGEIDAAFPMYSDFWINESKGLYQTDSIVSDRVMIVYIGNYREDLMDRVALSATGVGQRYYLSIYYPDAEMIFYNSREEAYAAMQNGEANCMIGCSSILQSFLTGHREYQDYHIAYLDTSEDFGIAVAQGESELVGILNKAVRDIDDANITSAMIQYSDVEPEYSLMYFIRRYSVGLIIILCAFFAILLGVFISYRHKTSIFNAEQAKTRDALEDALAAANAASYAKSTFLSSMSHDIRTPMNGIIGMTAIAMAHIDDPSRVEDCLKKITSSGKHLLALINEVLDMSKIESGEVNLNEQLFELSALIDDLITLNKPQADAKYQEMIVRTINISHESAIGDPLRIQQVFTNLVSNAIKYTPERGRIDISLSEKESGNPRLGCYEFKVKDNGIGMSEEFLPHIFDAFTRADETVKNQTQGTGLGMAITRNIVRMMDGDIKVRSRLGEGSEFTVTLYLKLREIEDIPYEDFVNLRVLVVDNDQLICESSCGLLAELGMSSEWVLSGSEAVKKVEKRHDEGKDYFAVLIDWKMPGMDGVETVREIRRRVDSNVPIIIISAYDWSAIELEAREAGVNGFIGKPLFKSRLVHLFDQLLGRKADENESGLKELTDNASFHGKRILMAEDNDINAEIAIEVLSMLGIEVDWAHNGKEAVEKMESSAPGYYDCIFMDVQMPVMNGLEAAAEIRKLQRPDAAKIPIFAMTANAFADDVRAAMDAGMNEHIAKPLDFNVLIKMLNRYFG